MKSALVRFAAGIAMALTLMACGVGCSPAERQHAKDVVIADAQVCAAPVIAQLATCYSLHKPNCVADAFILLTECLKTVTPPNPPAPVDAGPPGNAVAMSSTSIHLTRWLQEKRAEYSPPRNTWTSSIIGQRSAVRVVLRRRERLPC